MIEVRETHEFADCFSGLRDRVAKARIADRLDRLVDGHFGDVKTVGGGVSELRFHFGPSYRIYYGKRSQDGAILLLLAGGDKDSQGRDIALARMLFERSDDDDIAS